MIDSPSDFNYPPQGEVEGRVRLQNIIGKVLEDRKMKVHIGPPLGDWVEFRNRRIAVRRVRSDVFDGTVPEDGDGHPVEEVVTSDQGD